MQPMMPFLSEILVALVVSLTALALFRRALPEILIDLCGGAARAQFWNRFSQLMLLVGPLLGVLLLNPAALADAGLSVELLRASLRHALAGGFFTLSGLGLVIWGSIPKSAPTAPPPAAAGDTGD